MSGLEFAAVVQQIVDRERQYEGRRGGFVIDMTRCKHHTVACSQCLQLAKACIDNLKGAHRPLLQAQIARLRDLALRARTAEEQN